MGHLSRARNQRREQTRRFGKAIEKGWVMPTPPMPAARWWYRPSVFAVALAFAMAAGLAVPRSWFETAAARARRAGAAITRWIAR